MEHSAPLTVHKITARVGVLTDDMRTSFAWPGGQLRLSHRYVIGSLSGTVIASTVTNAALSPSADVTRSKQMNKTRIDDPYRNPFHNRFNVPVHSRLDEMQSYSHLVRLNDEQVADESESAQKSRPWIAALAGAFALVLVVVFSAAFLSKYLSN